MGLGRMNGKGAKCWDVFTNHPLAGFSIGKAASVGRDILRERKRNGRKYE
jgi:hypothetical protein